MNYNIEQTLENDFIAVLKSDPVLNSFSIRIFNDYSNEINYPVLLVQVSDVKVALNSNIIHSAIVEISCKTYIHDDKNRNVIHSMIFALRKFLYSNVKVKLNQLMNLKYIDIVFDISNYSGAFDDENTISSTLEVYFQL